MKGKRAFIFGFSNPIVLILLGILLVLVLLSFLGVAFFVKANAFMLLGVFLAVMGGIGLFMKFNPSVGFSLIAIGVIILLLPMLFKQYAGITLGAILT